MKIKRVKATTIGALVVVFAAILMAVVPSLLATHDPLEMDMVHKLQGQIGRAHV